LSRSRSTPPDDAACGHVGRADAAVELPGTGPAAYLDVDAVVTAATGAGCDMPHPTEPEAKLIAPGELQLPDLSGLIEAATAVRLPAVRRAQSPGRHLAWQATGRRP
jgi:hypothetical protein